MPETDAALRAILEAEQGVAAIDGQIDEAKESIKLLRAARKEADRHRSKVIREWAGGAPMLDAIERRSIDEQLSEAVKGVEERRGKKP